MGDKVRHTTERGSAKVPRYRMPKVAVDYADLSPALRRDVGHSRMMARQVQAEKEVWDLARYIKDQTLIGGVVTAATAASIEDVAHDWTKEGVIENFQVRLLSGDGAGQVRTVVGADGHTLTVDPDWSIIPSVGDTFEVASSSRITSRELGSIVTTLNQAPDAPTQFSSIKQTVGEISSIVAMLNSDPSAPDQFSAITQLVNEIDLRLVADDVITAINLNEEGVKIQADKIEFMTPTIVPGLIHTTSTQADWAQGTLTDVVATAAGDLELWRPDVYGPFDADFNLVRKDDTTVAPLSGYVATLRPGEGRFGGAVAVEEGTTNLFSSNRLKFEGWTAYGGAQVTLTQNVEFPEIGRNDATRIRTTGGTNTLKYYAGIETSIADQAYTVSVYIKNIGPKPVQFRTQLGPIVTVNPGEWTRAIVSGIGNGTTHFQLRFEALNVDDDLDFIAWGPQAERKPFATSFVDGTRAEGKLEYPVIPSGNFTVHLNVSPNIPWGDLTTSNGSREPLIDNIASWGTPGTDGFLLRRNRDLGGILQLELYTPTVGIDFEYPYTVREWATIDILISGSTASLYIDGQLIGSEVFTRPTSNILKLYRGTTYGYFGLIDELLILPYAASEEEIQRWYAQSLPLRRASSGTRTSPPLDPSPVGTAAGSAITWNATAPTGTSVAVETNLSLDGGQTWQGWQEVTNGGPIPGITSETDLSNAKLQTRVTLSTTDPTVTPTVHSLTVEILKESGAYNADNFPIEALDNQIWMDSTGLNMQNVASPNKMMNLNANRLAFWDANGIPVGAFGNLDDIAAQIDPTMPNPGYGFLLAQGAVWATQAVIRDSLTDYGTTGSKMANATIPLTKLFPNISVSLPGSGHVLISGSNTRKDTASTSDVLLYTFSFTRQTVVGSWRPGWNDTVTAVFSTAPPRTGDKSAAIGITASTSSGDAVLLQTLTMSAGQSATNSVYVSGSVTGTAKAFVRVRFRDSTGAVIGTQQTEIVPTGSWQLITVTATAPTGTTSAWFDFGVRAYTAGDTASAQFDDALATVNSGANLYADPGFEAYAISIVDVVTLRTQLQVAYSGDASAYMTVKVNGVTAHTSRFHNGGGNAGYEPSFDIDVTGYGLTSNLQLAVYGRVSAGKSSYLGAAIYKQDDVPLTTRDRSFSRSFSHCDFVCEASCEATCQSVCQNSCQSTCEKDCQTSCQTGCESRCETSCQTTCQDTCQSTCEENCQSTCEKTSQSCFVDGTPVTVYDPETGEVSEIPIEDLKPGMFMPYYDPQTDRVMISGCISNEPSITATLYEIEVEGPTVTEPITLRVTPEQPFDVWRKNRLTGEWGWSVMQAQYLKPGDKMIRPFDEQNRMPNVISVVKLPPQPPTRVWDPKTVARRYIVAGFADALVK